MVSLDSKFYTNFAALEIQVIAQRLQDILKSKGEISNFPGFVPDHLVERMSPTQVDAIDRHMKDLSDEGGEKVSHADVARLLAKGKQ